MSLSLWLSTTIDADWIIIVNYMYWQFSSSYCLFLSGQFIALSWETLVDSGNCAAVLPTGMEWIYCTL